MGWGKRNQIGKVYFLHTHKKGSTFNYERYKRIIEIGVEPSQRI